MILVCELSFDDGGHVPFNAGLLATIQAALPHENLVFYGSAAHMEELKKEVVQPLAGSISWREILPPAPGTVYLSRLFRELSIIRSLLKMLPQDATTRLVFTS